MRSETSSSKLCPLRVVRLSRHAANAGTTRLTTRNPDLLFSRSSSQNMTYELALMKAGKGKVSGVSGLDEDGAATGVDKE